MNLMFVISQCIKEHQRWTDNIIFTHLTRTKHVQTEKDLIDVMFVTRDFQD